MLSIQEKKIKEIKNNFDNKIFSLRKARDFILSNFTKRLEQEKIKQAREQINNIKKSI